MNDVVCISVSTLPQSVVLRCVLNLLPCGSKFLRFSRCRFAPHDQNRNPNINTFSVSLATRLCAIGGDVLVILITWNKTARLYHHAHRLEMEAPLTMLLFRDG